MFMEVHINSSDFRNALETQNGIERVECMKSLADKGDAEAAFWYGHVLLCGLWDIEKMTSDTAHGRLLPPTETPAQDPYLLYPSDQVKAVYYFKIAASCYFKNQQVVKEAQEILDYFEAKSNFGHKSYDEVAREGALNKLESNFYRKLSKRNGGVFGPKIDPLLPWPFSRPKVENPRTIVFEAMASKLKTGIEFQIFFSILSGLVFAPAFIGYGTFGPQSMASNFFIILPVLLVLYGISHWCIKRRNLPCCQCRKTRKLYELYRGRLPKDVEIESDPFSKAPFLVKNLVAIKFSVLAAIFSTSIALLILTSSFNNLLMRLLGLEKNTQDRVFMAASYLAFNSFAIFILEGLIPGSSDCERLLKEAEQK